ncbi:hypothetical protein EDM22_12340 [Agromyces tardus]|uniref:Uncharacterized protein n=1 Tax=Agromyces tardus TaxID=2583849 RepID=A0A3M8A835_9MICO|nr:hypothetical protein [Agromyces tardus]RNB47413.1 hypothetical protein EDM22_12340 [Agromyces tardus]
MSNDANYQTPPPPAVIVPPAPVIEPSAYVALFEGYRSQDGVAPTPELPARTVYATRSDDE